ncbi:MAG: hypothetical protein KBT72_09750 [Zhongshania sp.]|jgi:hypothetical protein|nr:hypothetical protein [Zhongshania sp.]
MNIEILTITLAVIVAIITFGQWQTSREAQKLALFEMRYEVYEKITGFIARILIDGTVESRADQDFLRDTKNAYFLFSGDVKVSALISEIYKKAIDLHCLEALQDSLPDEERFRNIEKQGDIKIWMSSTLSSMEMYFEKHLLLKH